MPQAAVPRPRSEAQRLAARRNGARSRGPVTAEGKARAARNALRHGLCAAETLLLPGEDPNAFQALLAALRAEHRPRDVSEDLLVERLAVTFWKLARCDRLEAELAHCRPRPPAGRIYPDGTPVLLTRAAELATLSAHAARLERALHRILKALADRSARTARHAELLDDEPAPALPENPANEPEPAAARPTLPNDPENRPNEPEPGRGTAHHPARRHPEPPEYPAPRDPAPPLALGRPSTPPGSESERPHPARDAPEAPPSAASAEARLLAAARHAPELARALVEDMALEGDLRRLRRLLDALGTDLAALLAPPAPPPDNRATARPARSRVDPPAPNRPGFGSAPGAAGEIGELGPKGRALEDLAVDHRGGRPAREDVEHVADVGRTVGGEALVGPAERVRRADHRVERQQGLVRRAGPGLDTEKHLGARMFDETQATGRARSDLGRGEGRMLGADPNVRSPAPSVASAHGGTSPAASTVPPSAGRKGRTFISGLPRMAATDRLAGRRESPSVGPTRSIRPSESTAIGSAVLVASMRSWVTEVVPLPSRRWRVASAMRSGTRSSAARPERGSPTRTNSGSRPVMSTRRIVAGAAGSTNRAEMPSRRTRASSRTERSGMRTRKSGCGSPSVLQPLHRQPSSRGRPSVSEICR